MKNDIRTTINLRSTIVGSNIKKNSPLLKLPLEQQHYCLQRAVKYTPFVKLYSPPSTVFNYLKKKHISKIAY